MSNAGQTPPRVSLAAQIEAQTRHARSLTYGMPWDTIEQIKTMATNLLEHPPAHPEKKREDIIRRIEEIQRLADELIQDMPKSKSRRGAVGLE